MASEPQKVSGSRRGPVGRPDRQREPLDRSFFVATRPWPTHGTGLVTRRRSDSGSIEMVTVTAS